MAKAFTPVLDFSHFLQALALSAVFYLNNSLYVPQIIGILEEKKTPFIDQKYTSEKVPNFGNARKSSCFFLRRTSLRNNHPNRLHKTLGKDGFGSVNSPQSSGTHTTQQSIQACQNTNKPTCSPRLTDLTKVVYIQI